jgi:hypothetical protein
MNQFLDDVEKSLKRHFSEYRIEFFINTPRSLKARVYLDDNYFIALRYNARNNRVDVALIKDDRRIFGYDNLKQWHFHPYENPSNRTHCNPPSIEKMISDTKKYYEMDKQEEQ